MASTLARHDRKGIVFIVATLLGWASVLLFLKHLTPYIDGWTANGWRYGVSAALWLPLLLAGLHRGTLPDRLWQRALIPSLLNCIGQSCFAQMPYYILPGLGGFLLRVSLVTSTGGALLLFADERPLVRSPLFWAGMGLVVAGSAGTIFNGGTPIEGGSATGIILGLCAGAFFGLYGVSVRYWMRGVPVMTSFAVISLYTAAGMIALMLAFSPTAGRCAFDLSAFNWTMLILSALIGIALGHVFYYAAIARLGVAISSGIIQLAPFLGAAGSMLIFHEDLRPAQWASGLVILLGATTLLRAEQRRRRKVAAAPITAPLELEDAGDPTAITDEPEPGQSRPL
jgi:drug/metabolite transporter (DMT)-like permease